MKSKLSLMPETAAMVLQSLPYRGSLIDRKALRLVWCPEPNDKSWKVVGSNLCLARIKNCPDANATEGWKRKNGLWSLIGKNPILFLVKKKAFVFLPRRFHSWSLSSSSSLSSPSMLLPSVVVLTRMMSRQKFFDVTLKRLRRDSGKKLSSAVIIFGCCKNAEFRWKKNISAVFSLPFGVDKNRNLSNCFSCNHSWDRKKLQDGDTTRLLWMRPFVEVVVAQQSN